MTKIKIEYKGVTYGDSAAKAIRETLAAKTGRHSSTPIVQVASESHGQSFLTLKDALEILTQFNTAEAVAKVALKMVQDGVKAALEARAKAEQAAIDQYIGCVKEMSAKTGPSDANRVVSGPSALAAPYGKPEPDDGLKEIIDAARAGRKPIGYITRGQEPHLAILTCLSAGDRKRSPRSPERVKPEKELWGFIYLDKPAKDPTYVRTTQAEALRSALGSTSTDPGTFDSLADAVAQWEKAKKAQRRTR